MKENQSSTNFENYTLYNINSKIIKMLFFRYSHDASLLWGCRSELHSAQVIKMEVDDVDKSNLQTTTKVEIVAEKIGNEHSDLQ